MWPSCLLENIKKRIINFDQNCDDDPLIKREKPKFRFKIRLVSFSPLLKICDEDTCKNKWLQKVFIVICITDYYRKDISLTFSQKH